jgi:hypothetical protein
VYEEPEPQVLSAQRRDVVTQLRRRPQPPQHVAGHPLALHVVTGEARPTVRPLRARPRLRGVVQQRGKAHRLTARELVGQGLAQQVRDRRRVLAEPGPGRVPFDGHDLIEHLERVVVHVEVVEDVLLDSAQRGELRQHLGGDAVGVHQAEPRAHRGRADHLLELAEDALGRDPAQAGRLPTDRRRRRRVDRELEVDGQPHGAQGAQRVGGEGLGRDHPQPLDLQIRPARVGIEQLPAAQRLGHGVHGEVALREVGVDAPVVQPHEVHAPRLRATDDAPRAEVAGQAEGGAAGRPRQRPRGLPGVLGHRQVEIDGGPAEQPVAYGAAHDPRLPAGEDRPHRLERDTGAHAIGSAGSGVPSRW